MPTWRAHLVNDIDSMTGLRTMKNIYKSSQYFAIYQSLLNHKKMIDCAKKYGYKIKFLSHPNMLAGLTDMQIDENIEILNA